MRVNSSHIGSVIRLFILTGLAAGISACGGSEDGGTDENIDVVTRTGIFIDAPVKGVAFSTSSATGVTNKDGEFKYQDGETVTFQIDTLTLDIVDAKPEINVLELNNGIAAARLLQSLDIDSDEGFIDVTGITIPDAIADGLDVVLHGSNGDLDSVFTQLAMDEIEIASDVALVEDNPVTDKEALDHISENLAGIFTLTDLENQTFVYRNGDYSLEFKEDGEFYEVDSNRLNVGTWVLEDGIIRAIRVDSNGDTETVSIKKVSADDDKYIFLFESSEEISYLTLYQDNSPTIEEVIDGVAENISGEFTLSDLENKTFTSRDYDYSIEFKDDGKFYEFDSGRSNIGEWSLEDGMIRLVGVDSDGETETGLIKKVGLSVEDKYIFQFESLDDEASEITLYRS